MSSCYLQGMLDVFLLFAWDAGCIVVCDCLGDVWGCGKMSEMCKYLFSNHYKLHDLIFSIFS